MISARSRALLDRYALASRSLSRYSGERMATEAGQSVEFHDYRPYQSGDELRYVDWKVYARTNRLYTRLFQAERTIGLHIVLDTSGSMQLGDKAQYARTIAKLLSYVTQRDALSQVHLFDQTHSQPLQGRAFINETWQFIDNAKPLTETTISPVTALKDFALTTRFSAGAGLVLIISDLLDERPLQPALAALKARGLDAGFLQVMSSNDLNPQEGQLEVIDVETNDKLYVTPAEVRAYKQAVQTFIKRTRSAILQAGFKHTLLPVTTQIPATLEQNAFASLVRAGILQKR